MIRFRALQRTVGIAIESDELRQDLRRLTASLAVPDGTPDVVYTVEQDSGSYTLECEGERWERLGRADVFAQLETDLSRRMLETAEGALLHGAALARDDQVYLFVGCSGCGKTTLSAALLKRGFSFLTDEYAAVSLEDRTVEACSMPLKLLQSTVERVPPQPEIELLPDPFRGKGQNVFYGIVDPGLLAPGGLPLGKLFFPWNRPGRASQIRRLDPALAIGHIMGCMLNAKRLGERAFRLATDVAESVPCLELIVGDIDEACRVVCEQGPTGVR